MSDRRVLACYGVDRDEWQPQFARFAPDLEVRYAPDLGDPAKVDYALSWNHPDGFWSGFSNLKLLCSAGAGVDRLLRDPDLPEGVPIVRLIDPSLVSGMEEFVLKRVLHYHRDMPAYAELQGQRRWAQLSPRAAGDRVVGVMGLGNSVAPVPGCSRRTASRCAAGAAARAASRASRLSPGRPDWAGSSPAARSSSACSRSLPRPRTSSTPRCSPGSPPAPG